MRMMLAVIFGLSLAGSAWAQSPQPPASEQLRSPSPSSPYALQIPPAEQRGTEDRPIIVKVIEPQKNEKKEADDERARREEGENSRLLTKATVELAAYTDKLAAYTGQIAILTFALVCVAGAQLLLFGWQLRIMNAGMVDTNIIANTGKASVDLAARTAAAEEARRKVLDRAYVGGGGMRRMGVGVNLATGVHFPQPTNQFEIHINNQGRMAAELQQIRYAFFDPVETLPDIPDYKKSLSFRDMVGPGARSQTTAVVDWPGEDKAYGIFVRFDYIDLGQNEPHSVGFVMKMEPRQPFPVPIPAPPAYIDPT